MKALFDLEKMKTLSGASIISQISLEMGSRYHDNRAVRWMDMCKPDMLQHGHNLYADMDAI